MGIRAPGQISIALNDGQCEAGDKGEDGAHGPRPAMPPTGARRVRE